VNTFFTSFRKKNSNKIKICRYIESPEINTEYNGHEPKLKKAYSVIIISKQNHTRIRCIILMVTFTQLLSIIHLSSDHVLIFVSHNNNTGLINLFAIIKNITVHAVLKLQPYMSNIPKILLCNTENGNLSVYIVNTMYN
jgi:hypothetical protein